MKKKAFLLIALLGLTSITACDVSIIFEWDVKDWDSPLEALSYADEHAIPSVVTSEYEEYGNVIDSKMIFKESLVSYEYTKIPRIDPTTEKYFEYHITSPYYEYVTVSSADLRIYYDGCVLLKVNITADKVRKFYFTTEESNAVSIYDSANEYLAEAKQIEDDFNELSETQTNVNYFLEKFSGENNVHGTAYIGYSSYGFDDNGSVFELMKNAQYTEIETAFSGNFGHESFIYNDTYSPYRKEESGMRYVINEDYNRVRIENIMYDKLDRRFYFYKDYSISYETGKSIYDAAFVIIRDNLGV